MEVRVAGTANFLPVRSGELLKEILGVPLPPKWVEVRRADGHIYKLAVTPVTVVFGVSGSDYSYDAIVADWEWVSWHPFPYTFGRVYERGVLIGYVSDYMPGRLIPANSPEGRSLGQNYFA